MPAISAGVATARAGAARCSGKRREARDDIAIDVVLDLRRPAMRLQGGGTHARNHSTSAPIGALRDALPSPLFLAQDVAGLVEAPAWRLIR